MASPRAARADEGPPRTTPGAIADDADETRGSPQRAIPVGHRRGVAGLAAVVIAGYALIAVARHNALQTTAFDLGIFFDAVRHWAHFQLPIVPVKGVHAGFGAGFDLLGDHFHPILVLLAPTYWIWPHPEVLLVDQAILMGVSVVPVWAFAHPRLASPRAAYLVAVAYALYWGLQEAVTFDFHEIAFAVPLIALAIERIDARRWTTATLAILLLAAVKEDLPLLIVAFGGYVAIKGKRWLGVGLAVYGVATFELITRVAIPYFAGGQGYVYWQYDELGPNLPSALGHMVAHPLDTARIFVTPAVKWHTELMLLAPFGFLTLASPIAILGIPLVAERFFSTGHQYWVMTFHYTATISPVIAMGAADGLARLRDRLPARHGRRVTSLLPAAVPAAMALAAVALVAALPFRELFTPTLWLHDAHIDAGHAAVAAVPPGVRVAATDELQPQLTGRDWAILVDGRTSTLLRYDVQYVAMNTGTHIWPFASVERQRRYAEQLEHRGWTPVFDRAGYVVLRAPQR